MDTKNTHIVTIYELNHTTNEESQQQYTFVGFECDIPRSVMLKCNTELFYGYSYTTIDTQITKSFKLFNEINERPLAVDEYCHHNGIGIDEQTILDTIINQNYIPEKLDMTKVWGLIKNLQKKYKEITTKSKHKYIPVKKYGKYNNMSDLEIKILDDILNYKGKPIESIWTDIEILQSRCENMEITVTADSIPDHYTKNKNNNDIPKHMSEPILFIEYYNLNFSRGCILKYLSRYHDKLPIADLEKVKFYSDCVINGSYKEYSKYKSQRELRGN